MTRHDKDDVAHLNLPDPRPLKGWFYIENGTVLDDQQYEQLIKEHQQKYTRPPFVCAKILVNKTTNFTTYYLLTAGSQLFDPQNIDIRYKVRNRWKLKRVKKSVYDLYLRFLKSRHKAHLYQAEREL